eukprot:761937-Hanusia_phi.AAC.5
MPLTSRSFQDNAQRDASLLITLVSSLVYSSALAYPTHACTPAGSSPRAMDMRHTAMPQKRHRTSSPEWSEQARSSFDQWQCAQADMLHAQWESAGPDSSSGIPSPSLVSSAEGLYHNDVELDNSFFSAEMFPDFSLDSSSPQGNKPKRRQGWRICTYIEGCSKAANFGDPRDGKPLFCLQVA